ncbi:RNA polymerase sigma factor [Fodinicola feengrottensis]|uniref:Sigma-70 family RNA polymerase sigma factor n=1 Tax=Fodinicola feengrottensis TaxID=435914 RepID=A0ABN2G7S4_9ACTN|nr:sigma-70 family RNA polymerase sigma factor [Fodinicola feengrottensis]
MRPATKNLTRHARSDGQLVSEAVAGDTVSWEELVRRFSVRLHRIAGTYGLDNASAADVVQTTWLRAFERLHMLRDPAAVGGWLVTITRRESVSVVRGRSRERLVDTYDSIDAPDDGRTPEDEIAALDQNAQVRAALQRLPQRDRKLLTMLMASRTPSYTAASAALNMPVGSIGPTRARSLAALRRELVHS